LYSLSLRTIHILHTYREREGGRKGGRERERGGYGKKAGDRE
jgi:hypothetical protein